MRSVSTGTGKPRRLAALLVTEDSYCAVLVMGIVLLLVSLLLILPALTAQTRLVKSHIDVSKSLTGGN